MSDSCGKISPIAVIHTDFSEKFGIPRQSGRVESLTGYVEFMPEYRVREAVAGLDEFSHIWLLFDFSEAHREKWSPTVRPPRLGGNKRVGVFASRSPFRPNSIGLSCVRLEKILYDVAWAPVLVVSGADLLDGTPIYDIKPYIKHTDCHPEADSSYADREQNHFLTVKCPENMLNMIPQDKREALLGCIRDDPRPSYQDDPERVYGMEFAGFNVRFRVSGREAEIIDVIPC